MDVGQRSVANRESPVIEPELKLYELLWTLARDSVCRR